MFEQGLFNRDMVMMQVAMYHTVQINAICDEKIKTMQCLYALQEDLCHLQMHVSNLESRLFMQHMLVESRLAEQARDIAALQAERYACAPSSARKRQRDEDSSALEPDTRRLRGAFHQAAAFVTSKIGDLAFQALDNIVRLAARKAGYPLAPGAQPTQAFRVWLDLFMSEAADYLSAAVTNGAALAVQHPSAAASLVFAMTVYPYIDRQHLVAGPWLKVIAKEILRAIVCRTLPEPFSTMLYYAPV